MHFDLQISNQICMALFHMMHTTGNGSCLPIGSTRLQYSLALMLWLLTSLRMRTQKKPTEEQNTMCHRVSVMGNAARGQRSLGILEKEAPGAYMSSDRLTKAGVGEDPFVKKDYSARNGHP